MPGAFTLVLETSTPHASIALVGPEGVVEQRGFCSDRNHNALLFEPLEALLHACGPARIALVLVGSGPGSYSGTRVGIAAAQGVAIALGCPAVAVPSILAVPCADGGASCVAIGDARRGSYWHAHVAAGRLTAEPALCDAAGLDAVVAAAAGLAVFAFEEPGRFPLAAELAAQVALEIPDATRLWQAWVHTDAETRRQWTATIPQPLYLKPPHITPAKQACWVRKG
ncbi:MAG: tRNA (adenosine(37)-N6)-threonylcarbamoyltransferase complex dimerization subunit type 1 TsaB [Verrucomicrobiota bacterium]